MVKVYEISFAEEDEYIILSETAIYTIIYATQKNSSVQIKISVERLVSAGYANYLIKMINANREHPMFRYQYLHKINIDYNDILLILRQQIVLLTINGIRCFTEVSIGKFDGLIQYALTLNPHASANLKDKKRKISIREYNRSEDD